MISVLLPSGVPDHESQLERVMASGTLSSFDPLVIEFVDAVSKAVLLDEVMRRMPEMAAVAHWMRKAHIMELRAEFEEKRGDRVWLARGVALHFAPANVDSIFLYSWFISMLVGNGNIVRLSERRGEQVDLLLEKIRLLLEQERFKPILDRNLILCYEYDEALTRQLSESCQLRVLWGGDESVRRLRAVPMNPLGNEVVFADRFSLAVLNAEEVVRLDRDRLEKLTARFCNDSYWFDQMACSSPRLVVWVGVESSWGSAQELFWSRIESELARRELQYPEVIGLNKLVSAYVAAGTGVTDKIHPGVSGPVSRIHLAREANSEFRRIECGGGFFFETEIPELNVLASLLTEKDQTLAYFGFQQSELKKLALRLPTRAIDRIVPIGVALNFNTVWDGHNLLQCFSREIDLQ
ncbi:MAG TPA: acyl-CoA reductase [Candidatus Acidoferrum sp.]|nr:acyl-CoA reductase [Candidatus Acidoferrum sp.]